MSLIRGNILQDYTYTIHCAERHISMETKQSENRLNKIQMLLQSFTWYLPQLCSKRSSPPIPFLCSPIMKGWGTYIFCKIAGCFGKYQTISKIGCHSDLAVIIPSNFLQAIRFYVFSDSDIQTEIENKPQAILWYKTKNHLLNERTSMWVTFGSWLPAFIRLKLHAITSWITEAPQLDVITGFPQMNCFKRVVSKITHWVTYHLTSVTNLL